MKLWLCGLVLAFATFVHIETTPTYEELSKHHIHTRGIDDVKVAFDPGFKPFTIDDTANETNVFEPFDVSLEGKFFWELLYYIDNTNKSNPYHETRKISKTIKTSFSELTKYVIDASIKISLNLEGGFKFEIVSATVKNSLNVDLSTSYQSTIESKTETTYNEEVSREFNVGANSIGKMYRLNYKGPGVTYATDTISTDETFSVEKVVVNCKVKRVPMIKDIQVVYTDQSIERPSNLITETYGGSPDLKSVCYNYNRQGGFIFNYVKICI